MTMTSDRQWSVLVVDPVEATGLSCLEAIATVDHRPGLGEIEICKIIGTYDAVIVRSGVRISEAILEAGKNLKIVGRAGVGVDNIDVTAASRLGIFVVNSPSGNVVAAAEHTLGLMLSIARNIPMADASVRRGEWTRSKFVGVQLQGRTLGIVGLGQVGSHLAKMVSEMGMTILGYDPFVNEERANSLGCRLVSLDDLLKMSDIVTLHVPLCAETRHLIDRRRLSLMKPTAILINVSRGGVVDEVALCEALTSNEIAGAALDVYENEKAFELDSRLLTTKNLVLTPHLGASTAEAQSNVAIDVAEQIKFTLTGKLPRNAVNVTGFKATESQADAMRVGEMLGRLAIQLLRGPLVSIDVTVESQQMENENLEPTLLAVAQGALSWKTAENRVNFVNVRQVVGRLKVRLSITRDLTASRDGIVVKLSTACDDILVRGAMVSDGVESSILLSTFCGVPVYLRLPNRLDGHKTMLWSQHEDTPGTLSSITKIIGGAGINISNCHLGRRRLSDGQLEGLAIFDLEGPVDETVLHNLRQLAFVRDCNLLKI